jgi:uncharacterized protein (DUF1810 family)
MEREARQADEGPGPIPDLDGWQVGPEEHVNVHGRVFSHGFLQLAPVGPGRQGRDRTSHNVSMPFDLDRFVKAQEHAYVEALDELRRGRKTGHWIWFIFPQVAGLGRSEMSRQFAITSLEEARAYLAHALLGVRVRECAAALLSTSDRSAEDILGTIDAVKVRSSMTLFHRAAPDEPVFAEVLERFYGGIPDAATDARL